MQFSHYSTVPAAIDMAPYASFYLNITREIARRNHATGQPTTIVEAGLRYGCSARIFLEALEPYQDWQLILTDPDAKPHALELAKEPRVTIYRSKAEQVVSKIPDRSVDLLHIDVDPHTHDLTLTILLAYWNKLKLDGEVIFHDCTDHFSGVVRLVQELGSFEDWEITYCSPADRSPISAPAHAKRRQMDKTNNNVSVVVPAYKLDFLPKLLDNIRANTEIPEEIIVIDNSKGVLDLVCDKYSDLPIRYLPQGYNIGVNASWNLGLVEARNPLVCILNDDLRIPDSFFRLIRETFESVPRAGVVVPITIDGRSKLRKCLDLPQMSFLDHREGWAFTIRKDLAKPIPSAMFTFCGDDWLYQDIVSQGYWPIKILNSQIHHLVGISGSIKERKRLGLPSFEQDRKAWNDIQAARALGLPDE